MFRKIREKEEHLMKPLFLEAGGKSSASGGAQEGHAKEGSWSTGMWACPAGCSQGPPHTNAASGTSLAALRCHLGLHTRSSTATCFQAGSAA